MACLQHAHNTRHVFQATYQRHATFAMPADLGASGVCNQRAEARLERSMRVPDPGAWRATEERCASVMTAERLKIWVLTQAAGGCEPTCADHADTTGDGRSRSDTQSGEASLPSRHPTARPCLRAPQTPLAPWRRAPPVSRSARLPPPVGSWPVGADPPASA